MNKPIAPCRGCPDREVGCHSICEKYLAYDAENKIFREEKIRVSDAFWIQNDIERRRIEMFKAKKFYKSRRTKE